MADRPFNILSLCSGVGGLDLGLRIAMPSARVVCHSEREAYCAEVLASRAEEEGLACPPCWTDLRTFDGRPWRGIVDVVSAGFPCQPFSVAGKRRGAADERNMWPETIRVIREVGPRFALLENVPGLVRTDYFGQVLGDLADAGLDAEWDVVSAAEVGAPHRRERLWILAYAKQAELRDEQGRLGGADVADAPQHGREPRGAGDVAEGSAWRESDRSREQGHVSNTTQPRLEERGQGLPDDGDWWESEPEVGRVAHGISARVDRLKGLGNAQVPRVVVEAWSRLSAAGRVEVTK